jgi:hypothetical protein
MYSLCAAKRNCSLKSSAKKRERSGFVKEHEAGRPNIVIEKQITG